MGAVRDNLQQNLNYYLKANKMTQKKLSELLDVSQAAVTNWTKGKNSPDIETLIRICNILKISINDLKSLLERLISGLHLIPTEWIRQHRQ